MAEDQFGNYLATVEEPPSSGSSGKGRLRSGTGVPDSGLGNNGDVYVNITTGDVYARSGDIWQIIQGAAGGSGEIGSGSPEGAVTATPGTSYVDSATNNLWYKISGVGNTGWEPFIQ